MKNAYIWNDTLMRGALKEMNFHIENLSGSSFFNVKEGNNAACYLWSGTSWKKIYDLAYRINAIKHRWQNIFFIDDIRRERHFYFGDVLRLSEVHSIKDKIEAVVANGTPKYRKKMAEILKQADISLVNLIDPSAIISPSAHISGGGTVIRPLLKHFQ